MLVVLTSVNTVLITSIIIIKMIFSIIIVKNIRSLQFCYTVLYCTLYNYIPYFVLLVCFVCT